MLAFVDGLHNGDAVEETRFALFTYYWTLSLKTQAVTRVLEEERTTNLL